MVDRKGAHNSGAGTLTLRPYQIDAIDQIRTHYRAGKKRVLLHGATGMGKTAIFCTILKGAYERGTRAVMVVRGKDLVDQASQRLFREGVPHGVLQGSHWNHRPNEPIQICSVDTLYRRKLAPQADLIVIDEAHFAISPSFKWFIDQYPKAFFLPVTATPHVKEGLRHIADVVVYPITIGDLISQGYLCPPRYYAPSKPNLDGVKIDSKTGDYESGSLADAVKTSALYGDIVGHYRLHAGGRAAVLFAVNVEHSQQIVQAFEAAGIPAAHCDADTPQGKRKEILSNLENGSIKVVSNVGILCTGVDMPYVSAVIMARPTKSYNLFIQQIGRGTRLCEGKKDFLVLDHAANIDAHGFIECEKECSLDGNIKGTDQREQAVTCGACYCVFDPVANFIARNPPGTKGRDYICPAVLPSGEFCRHDNSPKSSEKEPSERDTSTDEQAKLVEINPADAIDAFVEGCINTALKRGYKAGYVFHKIKEKFGEREAKGRWTKIKRRFPPSAA